MIEKGVFHLVVALSVGKRVVGFAQVPLAGSRSDSASAGGSQLPLFSCSTRGGTVWSFAATWLPMMSDTEQRAVTIRKRRRNMTYLRSLRELRSFRCDIAADPRLAPKQPAVPLP